MNLLTTENFIAERRANGDVLISQEGIFGQPAIIRIPMEQCKELAELLWPNVESDEEEWIADYNQPPYKVDYIHRAWEPE